MKQTICPACAKPIFEPAPQPALSAPKVSMQMLIDAGLNAFGLQLFCESFAGKIDPANPSAGLPFSFIFRGLKFTVEQIGGEEIDTRHH
jgi:hypothetical protein